MTSPALASKAAPSSLGVMLAILGRPADPQRAGRLFFDSSACHKAYTPRRATVTPSSGQAQSDMSEFMWRYSHMNSISVSELRHATLPGAAARAAGGGGSFLKPPAL